MPFVLGTDATAAASAGSGELVFGEPCECSHCVEPVCSPTDFYSAPDSLVREFELAFARQQAATAQMWRAAAAMHARVQAERGARAAEHVGADLAALMNVHPRTGEQLMITSLRAARELPELAELVASGALSARHVEALLDEVGRWTDTPAQAQEVLALTLQRCRDRAARHGWPTPGLLRKRLRTAALLLDLTAAEKRRRSVAERRGVALSQLGTGSAMLAVEGPDLPLLQAYEAIRARAEAMGRQPGDTRTMAQRMYDAAVELLRVDETGGESLRPTVGIDGHPTPLSVPAAHVAVVIPYSVTAGGEHELAEVPGFGPLLPSAARALLGSAATLQRVAVDATTGDVLAVDPPLSGPATAARVDELVSEPVVLRDLRSDAYRVPHRLRTHLELRDRTCVFPGCTVPGKLCDVDHREPWPRGATDPDNCHLLCRTHHRAKQSFFKVTRDATTGETLWTTPDGRTYRRPPPGF